MSRHTLIPSLSFALATLACVFSAPAPPGATNSPTANMPSTPPSAATSPAEPSAVQPSAPPANLTPTGVPRGEAVDLETLQINLQLVMDGLSQPTAMAHAGDGSGRLFIAEKGGIIRVYQDGVLLERPFLDIRGRVGSSASEQGLLGLAFHPSYASTAVFFVYYTDRGGDTVVSRFSVTSDPNRADPASEVVVLSQAQPAANHNGGQIVFGPDGYLYIGLGDGGGAGDVFGNGQNLQTWLGKILRIDVSRSEPYAVPPDNPFVGRDRAREEIWAWGLRNPWRFSFDRLTGDLYIADVGQNQYEEINVQAAGSPGGQNYGWPIMEGLHCFGAGSCDQAGLTMPVFEYDHGQGCSVTGGYVYRGMAYPVLQGIYFFGDYCSGRIWGMAQRSGAWQVAELAHEEIQLSSFGEDETGELFAVSLSGAIYRITTVQEE